MQSFEIQKDQEQSNSATPFLKKKFLKGYSKIHELKLVSIGLASPEKIQSWAEKELPNGKIFGEVTNANTFHYRTFQPTKGGLFCERIFGPLKDFECACGKRQKPTALESKKILEHKQTTRYFCSNCDVEYTWSIIRRYQLGYIQLNAPVTHLWYLKTNPSYLSIFFDMKRKDLEAVVYCTDSLTLENFWKYLEQKTSFYSSITDLYTMWQKFRNFEEKKQNYGKYFQVQKKHKIFERKNTFSFTEKKSLKTDWKLLSNSLGNKNFQETNMVKQTFSQNEKIEFFLFNFENLKEENLSPFQFKIYQKSQTQKKQIFFSFLFFQIFEKNLKKMYRNSLLKKFCKEFFQIEMLTIQKTNFDLFHHFFLKEAVDLTGQISIGEKKLFFFFFLLKVANAENFGFQEQIPGGGKSAKNKKDFLFLIPLVSFLKKQESLKNFLQKKKQKKKSNFLINKFDFSSLPFQTFPTENLKVFFLKEKRKNFISLQTLFTENDSFFKKEVTSEKLNKKRTLQISNMFIEMKKKRIQEKKQKKLQELLRSGFVFETLDRNIHSKKKQESEFLSQFPKFSKFQKQFNFSKQALFQTKNKKTKTSFLKNPILTIAYNFLWKNDSDWKYFVYSNSFFFSEFEDIPLYEQIQMPWGTGGFQNSETKSLFDERKEASVFLSSFENSQKYTQVGAGILEKLLTQYTPSELKKMIKQHQILLPKINQVIRISKQMQLPGQSSGGEISKKESLKIQKYIQKREHIVRRLKFLRKFFRKNSNPTFMILRNLPVLPPDLRPILKLQNQIAASDLNRFYQRIIYRNERLKKFSNDSAIHQSFEMRYAQRLLQEAVDNLIQNGKGGVKPETNSRGIPLKSLSEILKGKQGRFRQYLLGKRVDYSGRSVIVVGPKLKLYECGLPKEMAFELFLPFLIQQILQLNLAKTVIGAKNILKKDSTFAFYLLKKIMKNIPVLLNRAPTLHRLGFQAFLPKLVEGRAILLHPMVCPGFNADFDGDQMAVHVPLTVEARTEAWKFMLSTNNFINSATGDPVLLPTQDMVLGCYYLTTDFHSKSAAVQISNSLRKQEKIKFYDFQKSNKNFFFFSNFSDVLSAYQRKEISLHSPVWIRWNGFVDFGNDFTKPVEIQLRKNGYWNQIQPKITTFSNEKNEIFSKFIRTTPGRIFMNFMIYEFRKKE
jgi:DNA-directed RNA polymerase beta' subunit